MQYPSGTWRGFWFQDLHGRQEMQAFELHFDNGTVTGQGVDIVGPFEFSGTCDESTGQVLLVKQYLGKHSVRYTGTPDGEGCILGQWAVETRLSGLVQRDHGTFLMKPELERPTGDEPIIRFGSV
jgi:hypothetical protein